MRKHTLRALCMAFILTLCLPMVACDFEFGGLVGELLQDNSVDGVVPDEWESDLVIEEILPDIQTAVDSYIEDYTYPITEEPYVEPPMPDTTEVPSVDGTTEPPVTDAPIPIPIVYFSFDECDARIGDQQVQQFFAPGASASWDQTAVIDDYNVEYVRIWGWVAFDTEQIGEIGYRIDHGEYTFDNAFLIEAEQPILDAIAGIGALSASRIDIRIPVRDLSGEHVIEIVGRDAYEYTMIIGTFTLTKAVDPNAPVFSFLPADMISSMLGSPDLADVQLGGTGEYISITTGDIGDPWYLLPGINNKGYVANYVVIKYRTTAETTASNIYVGSGPGPLGQVDQLDFELINDGKWHLAILDLSKVSEVKNGAVNYLRWDMFREGQNNQIDLAYIAAFQSEQAALDYDASIADRYPD